jgi:hypothetical protein
LQGGQTAGAARCYFCGKLIREEDVQTTKHDVGHGYEMIALICPECRILKERGEGPFRKEIKWGPLVVFLVVLAVILSLVFYHLVLPAIPGHGLTLNVDRVEQMDNGFRVHMTATNHTGDALTLPLFGYFFVKDDLGNQYTADPFSSTFPRDVAPGATVSGYANMEKPLDRRASRLSAEFTTVFGSLRVNSARVENVSVR